VLVEALAHLAPQQDQLYLAIAGEGEQREALARQIERLGLQGRVRLLGHCEQAAPFLAALDVLALPSFHEGFPNAVLEAMAAGLPVVASAVGGVPEQVLDGQTGLLVPPGDDAALARALARLFSDPPWAARLGCAGRDRVARQFTLQAMASRTEALYASLLAEKRLAG
jgi:glycosyltransferase involved in cell wall biosynthesis